MCHFYLLTLITIDAFVSINRSEVQIPNSQKIFYSTLHRQALCSMKETIITASGRYLKTL